MPPKLRPVAGEETIRVLKRLGFVQIRQRGSHVVLKKQAANGELGCCSFLYIKNLLLVPCAVF